MKRIRFTVLALFLCGALGFQLFNPSGLFNTANGVEANTDELSNTYWNIDGTIYALNFDSRNGVRFLEYNSDTDEFDLIARGTYRIRGNVVTMTYAGKSGKTTISGSRRNRMTGRIIVDGETYVITATRAGD